METQEFQSCKCLPDPNGAVLPPNEHTFILGVKDHASRHANVPLERYDPLTVRSCEDTCGSFSTGTKQTFAPRVRLECGDRSPVEILPPARFAGVNIA